MTQHPQSTALLCRFYYRFLQEGRAADFIAATAEHYTLPTLHRLTRSHSPATRRSAILAVTFLGGRESLPFVGTCLRDTDRAVRLIASDGIHSVWNRIGSPSQCRRLQCLSRRNTTGEFEEVIDGCTELVREQPDFAEAWHQRGIAIRSQIGISESIDDFSQALETDPYHFTSALAIGDGYLELDNPTLALFYFQSAIEIFPDLEFAQVQVKRLERIISERLDH
ncbi:MAG: hypothetical protein GY768_03940 [Planctomycetaceae bacterium]|nr:hypothetical protein [Planctomycetaceae bacterium]